MEPVVPVVTLEESMDVEVSSTTTVVDGIFNSVDDIESEFGCEKPSTKTKERKKKRKSKANKKVVKLDSDKPRRVNHFVAIRVSNKQIVEQVKEIQEKILMSPLPLTYTKKNKKQVANKELNSDDDTPEPTIPETAAIFQDAMERVESLHFTVSVISIQGDDEFMKAKQAVETCWTKHKTDIEENPTNLEILGLGHFGNKVLFAKIQNEEHVARLSNIAEDLRMEFEKVNIFQANSPFKAHMTIAKMSRSKTLWKKKIRTFPREIWSEFDNHYFGQQPFESLQLLAMSRDNETKYYKIIAEYGSGSKSQAEEDCHQHTDSSGQQS